MFINTNVESILGVALLGNYKKYTDLLDYVNLNIKNKVFELIRVIIK